MTDVNFKPDQPPLGRGADKSRTQQPEGSDTDGADTLSYDLIELLFFAYRDFTGDPDDVLAKYEFGRAHHRVLHFVDRNPGIMVTDLLGILRITKQSLGRVLKQLVDAGIIEQREGHHDRRQRLLYTTERGHALAVDLTSLQQKRLERALIGLPDGSDEIIRRFLLQMIDPEARPQILQLIRSLYDLKD
ncbi:MarR family winged helix-turn-helix transcriptional regulator [Roseibium aggregatum]|jgi:DNA-binding MarR family transcriptional regulator|uniref:Transcriptional regulatory protein, MarR family protein n=1 Tax=Roseibium aggregatum (strain ATCC 25650 / DSM 13394 / JCM 20685 / NBRC 16684 / NCIMB 2208 / IAM 12614 / B1) TaxID=384765 RepID=A0NYI9_ROSAI|nr:MarR family winged helix-turn-helix transcriptional regulator [Roseibium aggregatum]EAV42185.1 Transcriptional regulatory protein, MarR family protein [Stappia aggregata IAM 12614] [Roseibium aggregatum IAM 12614]